MRRLALSLLLGLSLLAAPAVAGPQPDEILDDPALEARARTISKELRCVVCRNESIDDSNAPLARDMRIVVRERLLEGDSDEEAIGFIVARYGEFVLLRPPAEGANLILWIAAPAMFLLALGTALVYLRRRQGAAEAAALRLSPEEEARLKELLQD
jgi:cytochrome c-type biogenesis protein CcmH